MTVNMNICAYHRLGKQSVVSHNGHTSMLVNIIKLAHEHKSNTPVQMTKSSFVQQPKTGFNCQ